MQKVTLSEARIARFCAHLRSLEKSPGTVEHYARAVRALSAFARRRGEVSRQVLAEWKTELGERCQHSTANTMLAGVNAYLRFCGRGDWALRAFRIQRRLFQREILTEGDVRRLMGEARRRDDTRGELLLSVLAETGIRVSELRFVTVEAVEAGAARVTLKGRTRDVLLGDSLRALLRAYIRREGLSAGPIFRSARGRPLDRRRVWELLKGLCAGAGVDPARVHPHAFRRLFARVFYSLTRDLSRLADQLGHRSVDTTRIYVSVTARQHLAVLNRVSRAIALHPRPGKRK